MTTGDHGVNPCGAAGREIAGESGHRDQQNWGHDDHGGFHTAHSEQHAMDKASTSDECPA
jgi:hypothetical protein